MKIKYVFSGAAIASTLSLAVPIAIGYVKITDEFPWIGGPAREDLKILASNFLGYGDTYRNACREDMQELVSIALPAEANPYNPIGVIKFKWDGGIPSKPKITSPEWEDLIRLIDDIERLSEGQTAILELNTPGGDAYYAVALANAIRNTKGNLFIFVENAKSGGLIAALSSQNRNTHLFFDQSAATSWPMLMQRIYEAIDMGVAHPDLKKTIKGHVEDAIINGAELPENYKRVNEELYNAITLAQQLTTDLSPECRKTLNSNSEAYAKGLWLEDFVKTFGGIIVDSTNPDGSMDVRVPKGSPLHLEYGQSEHSRAFELDDGTFVTTTSFVPA